MNISRRVILLMVLLVASASFTGITSAAQRDGLEVLKRDPVAVPEFPDKSLQTSTTGFDYYIVDPNCEGSCIVTDYFGNWGNGDYFSQGTITGAWGVDGRDYYYSITGYSTESGVIHVHEGEATVEKFTRIGGGLYNEAVYGVWGFNTESIFAVGSQNVSSGANIFEYADGEWNEVVDMPGSNAFNAIWGASASDVFTVGNGGHILHYNGQSAVPMTTPTNLGLDAVWGTASDNVFACGWEGTMLHYDGTAWTAMSVPTGADLYAIWGTGPDDVYVSGSQSTILHYDGSSWSLMDVPATGQNLYDIWGSSSEEIVAVGAGGAIMLYDGTEWTADTSYGGSTDFRAVWGGLRAAGDQFWEVGLGSPAGSFDGFNAEIYQVQEYNGSLAVCGEFSQFGETPIQGLAYLNSGQWEPLYAGVGPNNAVYDLEVYNNQLICAGEFTAIDGNPINAVAYWDGVSWNQLGAGLPAPTSWGVWELVVFEGDLYALGDSQNTARWDGANWTPLTYSGDPDAAIFAATEHQGELYASCIEANQGLLKVLNGNEFQSVDTGFNDGSAYSIVSWDDKLYIGGLFTVPGFDPDDLSAQNFISWDENGFQATGLTINYFVLSLKATADGLFLGGWFSTINEELNFGAALWDGSSSVTRMGSGLGSLYAWDAVVTDEGLVVVGSFDQAGNKRPGRIARWNSQELGIAQPPAPTPATAGQDYNFSINLAGDPGPYPSYLYYRSTDFTPYSGALLTRSSAKDGVYEATIPGGYIGDMGFQFYVATGSGSDPIYYPAGGPDEPAFTGVTLSNESLDVPLANQYILMGVPFNPDQSLQTILIDALGSYDTSKWRCGRFDPTSGSYDEFPGVDAVGPGRGYWLIQKNPLEIPATGVTTSTVGNVVLTLEPGWNMIATPYNFTIGWGTVVRGANVENRLVARSGGGYTDVVVMNPWQGYWVRNVGQNPTTLTIRPIPLTKSEGAEAAPVVKSDTDWEISFNADRGDLYDHRNVAAVSSSAEPGIDAQDLFEVPAMPGDVSLYFEVQDGGDVNSLSRDVRQAGAEGQSWDMVLNLDGGGTVELNVDVPQNVPLDQDVILIGPDRTYNLRQNTDLRITVGSSGETRLRLAVGNTGFVEGQEQTMPRPYALRPAYPNPFNPLTKVSFTLPSAGRVKVDIYDVRGHLVRNLVDDNYEAGLHEVDWKGLDSRGRGVSAGVYFCRMQSGDFTQNQKMTLVR